MKKLLILIGFILGFTTAFAQRPLIIQGDTIILTSPSGAKSTLVIRSATKDTVNGVLTNIGGGVTQFKRVLKKVNDSTYLVGGDTLRMYGGSGGGGGGSMVYPLAGIANSTGSAWGTSFSTSGTGTTVALTVSPALTGTPTAPTQAANDSTTKLATTAFVDRGYRSKADSLRIKLAGPLYGVFDTITGKTDSLGIDVATDVQAGFLTAADHAAFNAKFNNVDTPSIIRWKQLGNDIYNSNTGDVEIKGNLFSKPSGSKNRFSIYNSGGAVFVRIDSTGRLIFNSSNASAPAPYITISPDGSIPTYGAVTPMISVQPAATDQSGLVIKANTGQTGNLQSFRDGSNNILLTVDNLGAIAFGSDTADRNSLIDVRSTTKGILIPRMTAAQRAAISSPATGMLVYQTDGTEGLYQKLSSGWAVVSGGGSNIYNSDGTISTNRTISGNNKSLDILNASSINLEGITNNYLQGGIWNLAGAGLNIVTNLVNLPLTLPRSSVNTDSILVRDGSGNLKTRAQSAIAGSNTITELANATDANFTATANSMIKIPNGILTANRTITMPTGTSAQKITFWNRETVYTLSLTGASCVLWDETVITALSPNTRITFVWQDSKWVVEN